MSMHILARICSFGHENALLGISIGITLSVVHSVADLCRHALHACLCSTCISAPSILQEKDKETKSKDKRLPEVEKPPEPRKPIADSPILKYIKSQVWLTHRGALQAGSASLKLLQVFNPTHSPLSTFLKAALIANDAYFLDILPVAWELLLEADVNVVSCAGMQRWKLSEAG